MVFPDVQAVLRFDAFVGYSGAHDLGKPVDVDCVDAESGLQFVAHLLCPGLRAVNTHLERQFPDIHAHGFGLLGQVEGVGGCATDARGCKVLQQHDLFLGLASGHGRDHHPQFLAAVVQSQAAGEEPVTIGVVQAVPRAHAGGCEAARHQLTPGTYIPPGVADYGGFAGGTR